MYYIVACRTRWLYGTRYTFGTIPFNYTTQHSQRTRISKDDMDMEKILWIDSALCILVMYIYLYTHNISCAARHVKEIAIKSKCYLNIEKIYTHATDL